MSDVTN